MPESLASLIYVIAILVLVIVGVQNLIYTSQLFKSIWTRCKVPLAQGTTQDLWNRIADSAIPVSVIVPAFNEELTITESVRSLLSINYPNFEVIVINDGSQDKTLQILKENYQLEPSERRAVSNLDCSPVKEVFRSRQHSNLLIVDKENGRKADAANAGINYAKNELICVIDADSVLEADGLLRAVEPFIYSDGALVATGGVVRLTNGCKISGGQVTHVGNPKKWLVLFQTLEYLRAFIVARVATSGWSILSHISGAFGVFDRQAVVDAGGYSRDSLGEDLEMVVTLHRHRRENDLPCKVKFVADAVCWTEAPSTLGGLKNQRSRWEQGALQTIWKNRSMLFNKRYGRIGLVAMPLILWEDVLVPVAEITGYILLFIFWYFGLASPFFVIAMLILTVFFGTALTLGALAHEELQLRPVQRTRDYAMLVFSSFVENLGYRQMNSCFRILGMWKYFRKDTAWAAVPREGF